MSGHDVKAAPLNRKFITPGVVVLICVFCVGMAAGLYRFVFGLGALTNLNDQYPFGIWIGVDVAGGVALAAGGFTTAALIHIFYRDQYAEIGRPAHLTAMLGYTFVVIGLLFDLGRWYNVWHPILPPLWQGNSVMFEVAMCVMAYLTVLYIEFLPIVTERFIGRSPDWINTLLVFLDRILDKVLWLFIIMGVVLSCLHQSSLGNMMVIAPYKMHPLWYSPGLSWLFLASAMALGFPMVVFESMLAGRSFGRKPEMHILKPLSRLMPIMIGIYFFSKVIDLTLREAWGYVSEGSLQSGMFLLEGVVGLLIPLLMLLFETVRSSPKWLFLASSLYIFFGVLLNRINVFLIAYQPPYREHQYIPAIGEIAVTLGLIAALMLVYRIMVTIFPILPVVKEERV